MNVKKQKEKNIHLPKVSCQLPWTGKAVTTEEGGITPLLMVSAVCFPSVYHNNVSPVPYFPQNLQKMKATTIIAYLMASTLSKFGPQTLPHFDDTSI